MSTSAERTIRIPFENRTIIIPRGSTPKDRTVHVTETS